MQNSVILAYPELLGKSLAVIECGAERVMLGGALNEQWRM